MTLDDVLDISIKHGGLRFWRTSERASPDIKIAARMFCFRERAHSNWNVEWRSNQWTWPREFSEDDRAATDWCIEDGPIVDHPRQREPRSCNRHTDCNAVDDKVWPRFTDHCHDDDCEDCFGQ